MTSSTDVPIDVLDAAISAAVGFAIDSSALGKELYDGLVERVDPEASQPDDWDADEDGPWEPPKLAASDATTLLAAAVTRPDANAAALKDAYSFSSSPQIVRHRDTAASGEALRYECTDFGHGAVDNDGKPEARPALVAMLYADAPGSGS